MPEFTTIAVEAVGSDLAPATEPDSGIKPTASPSPSDYAIVEKKCYSRLYYYAVIMRPGRLPVMDDDQPAIDPKAYRHAYYLAHKDQRYAYSMAWRKAHPGAQKRWNDKYRSTHKNKRKRKPSKAQQLRIDHPDLARICDFWTRYRRANLYWYESIRPILHTELSDEERRQRKRELKRQDLKRHPVRRSLVRRTEKHNRQAKLRGNGGRHTAREWSALCVLWNHRCLCCGSSLGPSRDHIVPLALGGTNDASNLQLLCVPCNVAKALDIVDFRPNLIP